MKEEKNKIKIGDENMEIKQSLISNNIWWNDQKINPEFLLGRKRNEFDEVIKKLKEKRILAIIGPRRVGKSTIMYQTIDYLLNDKKINPKRILLFSGDDPSLFFREDDKLSDVLEVYFDEILCEPMEKLTQKVYILIDEIHFIKNWQNFLKVYFDRKYNIKFIITGSSSVHLYKDSNESLLGRIENLYVLPLTFNQFLNFYQTYVKQEKDIEIPKFDFNQPEESFKRLEKLYYDKSLKIKIKSILAEYLIVGGYPEYFENRNLELWQKRLAEDIISRGIYKDILTIYDIKNPDLLEKLMYYITANNAQTFSYSNIAKDLGMDTTTIINYIYYLKQAFLINILECYSTNVGKVIRMNKKLSVLDNGIKNSFLKRKLLDSQEEGKIVEGMVDFDIRLLAEKEGYGQYYYRENKEEIDIILDRKIDVIPIEVKYVNNIKEAKMKNISKFIKENEDRKIGKTNYGMIITKDTYQKQENLYYVPYWLFHI